MSRREVHSSPYVPFTLGAGVEVPAPDVLLSRVVPRTVPSPLTFSEELEELLLSHILFLRLQETYKYLIVTL